MSDGWIKLHRSTLDNPIVCKDTDHVAVWIYLLLNATHTNYDAIFKGKRVTLQPGQLITGRKAIAACLYMSESKVQRILKIFESEQQIEQQTSNQKRLISILNWGRYQQSEQQIEQQVNNDRTTTEQQVNTNKNDKNDKKDNKLYTRVIDHLNIAAGTRYKPSSKATQRVISARASEGFTAEDMMRVIDIKADDWKGTEFEKYLRPETLFGSKFEGYLNSRKEEAKTEIQFLNIGDDDDAL